MLTFWILLGSWCCIGMLALYLSVKAGNQSVVTLEDVLIAAAFGVLSILIYLSECEYFQNKVIWERKDDN